MVGASIRQEQRGSSSKRSVSSELVSLDTPVKEEEGGNGGTQKQLLSAEEQTHKPF